MKRIETLIEELKEQTGLEFSFRPLTESERFPDGIFTDEESGSTAFVFSARGKRYLGSLYGNGVAEYNYALLFQKLVENDLSNVSLSKSEYLRSILEGKQSAGEIRRFSEKYSMPEGSYYVICLYVEKNRSVAEEVLSQATTSPVDYLLSLDENRIILFKYEEGEADRSAFDYAFFLARSVFEEVGVHPVVGVGGCVKRFSEILDSYRQASLAVRMAKTFRSKGEVHTYREFLLVKMLEEIPISKRREYMNEFLTEETKELLEDEDMLNTAEEFFSDSLNLSETARKLFMHRNTLMYRLDKIQRMTGLDIRKFSDAISFRVLTLLYKLWKEEKG